MPLPYDKLAIKDETWLQSIRETFNLTEQAKKIGIPLHDSLESVVTEAELLFNPTCFLNISIDKVRRIVLGAALRVKPNAYIKAYSQADLLRILMDRNKKKQDEVHNASMLFIYDCAVFTLKDWEQRLIGELVMKRRAEYLHISFMFEFGTEHVISIYGTALYNILRTYCTFIAIEKEGVENDS